MLWKTQLLCGLAEWQNVPTQLLNGILGPSCLCFFVVVWIVVTVSVRGDSPIYNMIYVYSFQICSPHGMMIPNPDGRWGWKRSSPGGHLRTAADVGSWVPRRNLMPGTENPQDPKVTQLDPSWGHHTFGNWRHGVCLSGVWLNQLVWENQPTNWENRPTNWGITSSTGWFFSGNGDNPAIDLGDSQYESLTNVP